MNVGGTWADDINDGGSNDLPAGALTIVGPYCSGARQRVRKVSKQRWVILRHVFGDGRQIGEIVSRSASWCVPAVLVVVMQSAAYGQVILPLSPPASPPWSSVDVFDPVPFSQLLSRDPADAAGPEDTPVRTRIQPGYESVGVRSGPWMFNPAIGAGAIYNSNVFAASSGQQSDVAGVLQPALGISSLWERHGLDVEGSVRSKWYRQFPQLDQTDASLRLRGRIDLWHDAAILLNLRTAYLHEGVGSLTSPTGAAEPTPYSVVSGGVMYWQRFNRLAASVGVRRDYYNYGSTIAQNGSVINQDSRDGRIDVAHGRLDYAISSVFGLFSALEVNNRDLRGSPTQSLSSDGYRSLTGFNFQLGNLISGEIGAGYSSQRFDDPATGTIAGPAYRALINWSVTRLLDIHFKTEQIVTQASDTVGSGIQANAFQLGADYELRRNVILSVAAVYERDKFFGQPRNDDVFSTFSELRYLLNRYSTVSLQHQYLRRESSNPGSSYDKHEVGLNVTARY